VSRYTHAQLERRIISLDRADPGPVQCCWPECDRRAVSLYQIVLCEHSPAYSCSATERGEGGGRHYRYTFCRERCRAYFAASMGRLAADTAERNQGRISGNLPAGYRHSL
jgi:hypothetical protein